MKMDNAQACYTLRNGIKIPCIGMGTWKLTEGDTCERLVQYAIELGYRLFDTAANYGTQRGLGRGIALSGIKREDVFITSKLWNTERGYATTLAAFERTLNELQMDYLDLYLIHWPAAPHQFSNWEQLNLDTWRAMTELYNAGKIRAIGVSNFLPHHLRALMETEVKPMVNQLQFHPGMMQEEAVAYCRANDILVEAWSPLGSGKILNNALLNEIAAKYGKSTPQICLRWVLQHGLPSTPRPDLPEHLKENLEIFDFEISDADMQRIDAMPYVGGLDYHPDSVKF